MKLLYLIVWAITRILGCVAFAITEPILRANVWCAKKAGRMNDVPPQNLEAEESVLGALTLSENAVGAVPDVLEPSDFYRESHGLIYQAALGLFARSESVDVITPHPELEQSDLLERAGGKGRIYELAKIVPASANVKRYAEIVKEKSNLRGLIHAGKQIEQLGLGWG